MARSFEEGKLLAQVDALLLRETAKAMLIVQPETGKGKGCWIPTSQMRDLEFITAEDSSDVIITVKLPLWLIDKNDLEYEEITDQ